MSSNRFEYTPEIDSKVTVACSQILHEEVVSSKKIEGGEFNYVYKVETESKKVVIRVFSHKTFPSAQKLEWVNKQLRNNGIPHAELLYYTRESEYFPYGFMISDFVEGQNAFAVIKSGQISVAQFHEKLGSLLKKVNAIKLKKYGQIENGDGTYENLLDFYLAETKKALNHESVLKLFTLDLFALVEEKVRKLLTPFETTFEPILVHKDATPDNCILTSEGELVLVDWDSAISSIWVADYAIITYSGSHLSELGSLEKRQRLISQALQKGYAPIAYTPMELENIETAFHIFRACELLPYYASFQNNSSALHITKEKLSSLLS